MTLSGVAAAAFKLIEQALALPTVEQRVRIPLQDLRCFGVIHKSRGLCLRHLQTATGPWGFV